MSEEARPALEPEPKKVNPLAGEYRPKTSMVIRAAGVDMPTSEEVAAVLALDLRQLGFHPSVTDIVQSKADITLSVTDDLSLGDGYRLMVSDSISVVAATGDGLRAGALTLVQLLSAGPNVRIRRVRIED